MTTSPSADAGGAGTPPLTVAELSARIDEVRRRRRETGSAAVVGRSAPPAVPTPRTVGPVDPAAVCRALCGGDAPPDEALAPPPINVVGRFYFAHAFFRRDDADFIDVAYLAVLKRLPFATEVRRRRADLSRGAGRGVLLSRLRFSPEGREFGVWICGLSLWALVDLIRVGPRCWDGLRRCGAAGD